MDRFNKFSEILRNNLDGFEIRFKNESSFMKFIGMVMFFNKRFMSSFITTIGKKVYWPSRERLEKEQEFKSMATLAHEYQHAKDYVKHTPIVFNALYLFPQILALPGIILVLFSPLWISLMITGIISWSWWLLPILLTIIFAAPLPAPGRRYYELRGYTMSLFVTNEHMKEAGYTEEQRSARLMSQIPIRNQHFTGQNYYFMWPFGVEKDLNKIADDIISGKIYDHDPIYSEIAKAISDSK